MSPQYEPTLGSSPVETYYSDTNDYDNCQLVLPSPNYDEDFNSKSFSLNEPSRGSWSTEEDKLLISLVKKHGTRRWTLISKEFKGKRMGKQCRERWHNHLNPTIRKTPFSFFEDIKILTLHDVFGSRWATMKKFLKGRTDNSIKNHWHSSMIKKASFYRQSLNAILKVLIEKDLKNKKNEKVIQILMEHNKNFTIYAHGHSTDFFASNFPEAWHLFPHELSLHLAKIQEVLVSQLFNFNDKYSENEDDGPNVKIIEPSTNENYINDLLEAVDVVEQLKPKH